MPYVIRPRTLRAMPSLLGAVALLLGAPALAQAACPSTPAAEVFQSFSDTAQYSLVPGGAFESGTAGWSLTGASVASGNESYYVHGAHDSKSLAIQPTGVAISPPICVSIANPTFRFFAKRTSGTWGQLAVSLLWQDSTGATNETTVASIGSGTTWTPTAVLSLAQTLPLWQASQTLTVRFVFAPANYGGAWAIDDVYFDPYARR